MTPSSFKGSPAKDTVRKAWNTPLLRYLHQKYGIKYRYLGLPGTDLVDVQLWADMIQEVTAFETMAPGPDDRAYIRELRANMGRLGIPGVAYYGSFEEVVLLRRDYDGQDYSQGEVITLYNLDFCDEIASLVRTRESGQQRWRFEALRVILQDQKDCYRRTGESSCFLVLLTFRNQIEASRIRDFLSRNLLLDTSSYCSACGIVNPIPESGSLVGSHAWCLKAFLYNTLREYFVAPNICTLFFPMVKYIGTPVKLGRGRKLDSPMLHWMLLCRFGPPEDPTPSFYPNGFLDAVISLTANGDSLGLQSEPGEVADQTQSLSPVKWLQPFESLFFG